MRVIIVGNGQWASAALKSAELASPNSVQAVFTSSRPTLANGSFAHYPEAGIQDACFLAEQNLLTADWLLIADSTTIIPKAVLAAFVGRSVNVHPGILPFYAGLHCHQWAIRNGDKVFGVTLHEVTAAIDAGDIFASSTFPIDERDTGLTLYRKYIREGATLISKEMPQILTHRSAPAVRQDAMLRHVYKHQDALREQIDWNESALRVQNFVRAGAYFPLSSPTYTAAVSLTPDLTFQIIGTELAQGNSAGEPGDIIGISDAAVRVVCGEGTLDITRVIGGFADFKKAILTHEATTLARAVPPLRAAESAKQRQAD